MNFSDTEIAVIGTLGGALIGSATSVITNIFNKRSEERRSLKDLVIKTAADNWKLLFEETVGKHPPMATHMIYMAKMVSLAFDEKVTTSNLGEKLEEISKLVDVMHAHTRKVSEKK